MRIIFLSLAAVTLFFPVKGAHGQSLVKNPQGVADASQVTIDVVVTDKKGHPVAELTQNDFVLKDNATPRPVTGFRVGESSSTPTEAILLIDAVNVNFTQLADERSRIERFLKANNTLPVPTALAIFTDDGIKVQQNGTTDGKALRDEFDQYITGLRTIRRSSQREQQDRFDLSLKNLSDLIRRESVRPGRKMIFWVSPGWPLLAGSENDLTSKQQDQIFQSIVAITDAMLASRITLYSLNPLGVEESVGRAYYYQEFLKGVTKPGQAQLANLSLQVLATQSGGLVLNSSNDLENELKVCFEEAKASYEISFDLAGEDPANKYHHLELSVEKPGLTARAKSGYYAHPEH